MSLIGPCPDRGAAAHLVPRPISPTWGEGASRSSVCPSLMGRLRPSLLGVPNH
jgi:hypothetical protein